MNFFTAILNCLLVIIILYMPDSWSVRPPEYHNYMDIAPLVQKNSSMFNKHLTLNTATIQKFKSRLEELYPDKASQPLINVLEQKNDELNAFANDLEQMKKGFTVLEALKYVTYIQRHTY